VKPERCPGCQSHPDVRSCIVHGREAQGSVPRAMPRHYDCSYPTDALPTEHTAGWCLGAQARRHALRMLVYLLCQPGETVRHPPNNLSQCVRVSEDNSHLLCGQAGLKNSEVLLGAPSHAEHIIPEVDLTVTLQGDPNAPCLHACLFVFTPALHAEHASSTALCLLFIAMTTTA
jgi:hypothetical protein